MINRARAGVAVFATALCAAAGAAATSGPAHASAATTQSGRLTPGNLLVSESFYTKAPNIVAGQTQLPPGCSGTNCVTAVANGNYPQVFNNALVDGSFGVTSRIFLSEMTPSGIPLGTVTVPPGRLVTSCSALCLSTCARSESISGDTCVLTRSAVWRSSSRAESS